MEGGEDSGAQPLIANTSGRDFLLLGAGFSRAVNQRFPITDELGRLAVSAANVDAPTRFPGGSFETWLSYLAEPQPFLKQAENLANRALFALLVDAVHTVLCSVEGEVEGDTRPPWLFRLVTALHSRRSVVITFNYDRVVERTLDQLRLIEFSQPASNERVQWFDTLQEVPPFPPNPSRWGGGKPKATLRLCKLHGSLNWFWVPGDESGATMSHWELQDDAIGRSRFLPGREPFVVPPASTKSAFFANPVMSETWRQAHQALRNAEHVWFVGYSLPLTDLTSAGMVATTLNRQDVQLEVVNPSHVGVLESLRRLTDRDASVRTDVAQFADSYSEQASRSLAQRLRSLRLGTPSRVLVGWNREHLFRVSSVSRSSEAVVVRISEFDSFPTGMRFTEGSSVDESSMARQFDEVTSLLRAGDRIEAVFPDGSRSPIVGVDCFNTETGASTNWQVLIPADHPSGVGVGASP